MRPHRLRLAAFGPFAGEVEVDFDALSDGGLFLLHGDTGSGKTSVLDGLAFALYGRVPGQRAGAGRLRSDHADPQLRTSVELEVTVARRRFRITRSPEQVRPKLRGSGTTREPARVLLQEAVDGGWVALSTRVGEADAELARLLGMSAEQFHQVVVLPQGEFARFLRSDASDRARLLQRLFATDRFRRAEDWLAERRRQVAAEFEAARVTLLRAAARVAQVAGVPEPDDDENGLPSLGWAEQLATDARGSAGAAEDEADRTSRKAEEAGSVLAGARDLHRRQRRRADLLRRWDEVRAAAGQLAEATVRLERGRRAAEVRPVLAQLDRRLLSRDEAARAVERLRPTLESHDFGALSREQLRAEAEQRRQALGRLEAAQRLEDELVEQLSRGTAAETAAEQARAERDRARQESDQLPELRRQLTEQARSAAAAREQVPALAADLAVIRSAAGDAQRRDLLERERAKRAAELLAARERAVGLREKAARLRVERVDSMIAELAAALVDGDPCPVCGATDHPDPSEVFGSRVTREQEDAARAEAERAQQVVADVAAAAARLDTEYEGCVGRLDELGHGSRPASDLTAMVAAIERKLAAAHRIAEQADGVAERLVALDHRQQALSRELQQVELQRAQQRERAEQAAVRSLSLRQQLAELLGGGADVHEVRDRELRVVQVLDDAVETLAAAASAEAELRAAQQECRAAVEAAGFSGADDARSALVDPHQLEKLAAMIDEVHTTEASLEAALRDPDVDVDLEVPAGVAQAEQAFRDATDAARAAAAAAARARHRATELDALAPAFEVQLQQLRPLRQRMQEIRALADLAAGQGSNRLRMTLSAFVLAARLEEVAAVASERLRRMTQGRYTLVHTDAGRGGGRAGLGLLARDTWTGQDRDTATLSGGETFLASLALALALGDVVTAEAGGAGVEALFVDEGFGSLDEETLEEVMDTLDSLREGGRMVGLVSHVGELRARIPAQLHVHKTRAGSTVTLRTA